jgi:DMSO/TMAO reductase YedYZ molybdopterin-dependent catalytic subunit
VRTFRGAWALAGLVAGFAGVAVSYCVASVTTTRDTPVVAIAEMVIRLTPGAAAERAIDVLGHHDKPVLVAVILVLSALLFAWAGLLARRTPWAAIAVYVVMAAIGGIAVWDQRGSEPIDLVSIMVGFLAWLAGLALLTAPLRRAELTQETQEAPREVEDSTGGHTRRTFLLRAAAVTLVGATLGVVGRAAGSGRRHVEEARRLLRLPRVTMPQLPRGVDVGVDGVSPWKTAADDFYRVDTAILPPAIEPIDWQLRIHGLVDREIVIDYQQLLNRPMTQAWITLNCVSNEVGGDLIGNAWWSGFRVADLLREAGVHADADAVLQTSDDGWTCGTPLSVLTDDRNAILAVAMNGKPLPIDHGFPVRTLVPGLYGYVSACKWVVEMEVTRFADIEAYWTSRGWSEKGPVKLSSRIDVPDDGDDVAAGPVTLAGVAWAQHTGIRAVEVALDDGDWQPARLASAPTDDTWVQWTATVDVEPGEHSVKVRATDKAGQVQTGVEHDVVPDGATGWDSIDFEAR